MVMNGEGGWEILTQKTRLVSSAAEFEGPLSLLVDKVVIHNGVIHMAEDWLYETSCLRTSTTKEQQQQWRSTGNY